LNFRFFFIIFFHGKYLGIIISGSGSGSGIGTHNV